VRVKLVRCVFRSAVPPRQSSSDILRAGALEAAMTSKEGPVLVLGAGPEGRAVVYALFSLGVSEVLLYDENKARQAEGVKRMAMAALETAGRVDPLEGPVDESVLRCTGIVNATRKGYAPPQFLVSFTYVISTFFKNARNHVFRSKMREISEFSYVNQIKSNQMAVPETTQASPSRLRSLPPPPKASGCSI